MVLKGAKARKLKKIKLVGRPERSLYVSFRKKVDRTQVVEILSKAHPDIERVFLPRQKIPKSVYVLCKGPEVRDPVRDCLRKLKNEELGRLRVENPREPIKKEPETSKEEKTKLKRKFDPRCLLLEFLPKEVTTEVLENEFPEAEKVDRFNKRRCYIRFKKTKDAMKARIRISSEKIAGHDLKVKFNKIQSDAESDNNEDNSNSDSE